TWITPHTSEWLQRSSNSIKTEFNPFRQGQTLQAEYVIPSHGKPFYDANKRIDEIVAHHDDRLNETLQKTNEYQTVYRICEALFQFELTVHETRFAIGETIAHLEYLRHKGELEREEIDGIWHYEVK